MGIFFGFAAVCVILYLLARSSEASAIFANSQLVELNKTFKSIETLLTRQVENTIEQQTQNLIDQAKGK